MNGRSRVVGYAKYLLFQLSSASIQVFEKLLNFLGHQHHLLEID